MIINRSFKNNIGYMVDVDRPKPLIAWNLERYNKNISDINDGQVKIEYNRGNNKGLIYGGGSKQAGKGDLEVYANTAKMLVDGFKQVGKFYSSPMGTYLKNSYGKMLNENNPNWRPGFAGEKHLMSTKGLTYNFCGPGTNLKERLKRGDPPLDSKGLDMTCKIHDIDYHNANNWEDVRQADKKFIKNIDNTKIGSKSKTFIKGLFKGKMIGEDLGVIKRDAFTSFPNIQDEQPRKIQNKDPIINAFGKGIKEIINRDYDKTKGDPVKKLRQQFKKLSKNKKYKQKKSDKLDKIMNIAVSSIKKRL